MSSIIQTTRTWEQAESLVKSWDRGSRKPHTVKSFADQIAKDLSDFCKGSVIVWASEQQQWHSLAIHPSVNEPLTTPRIDSLVHTDLSPVANWATSGVQPTGTTLQVDLSLHPAVTLTLLLSLPADSAFGTSNQDRKTIADVSKAAVEILSLVYLRSRLSEAIDQENNLKADTSVIAALYQGNSFADSCERICLSLATHANADRVSIVRLVERRSELIATSTGAVIDRRAEQVLRCEQLANQLHGLSADIRFTVGQRDETDSETISSVQTFIIQAGCREIQTRRILHAEKPDVPIVLVIVEWFAVATKQIEATFWSQVDDAVRVALERETHAWPVMLRPIRNSRSRRKLAWGFAAVVLAFAFMCIYPVTFSIPADGKLVPVVQRRVFAPADATVVDIAVKNGQSIKAGERLMTLRSTAIDLREEELRGHLLTAQTQLATLAFSRSGTRRDDDNSSASLNVSTNEETLKSQVRGYVKQLTLVESQQKELVILSPLGGRVERWLLEQTLSDRPVGQGQYLLDIYAPDSGWVAEVDVADKDIGYVLSTDMTALTVTCRMRSMPDRLLTANVIDIARSAQIDSQGRSVVRLKCGITDPLPDTITIGSTVWANIDCGKRSIAFVTFRGLIQWWASQSWF